MNHVKIQNFEDLVIDTSNGNRYRVTAWEIDNPGGTVTLDLVKESSRADELRSEIKRVSTLRDHTYNASREAANVLRRLRGELYVLTGELET